MHAMAACNHPAMRKILTAMPSELSPHTWGWVACVFSDKTLFDDVESRARATLSSSRFARFQTAARHGELALTGSDPGWDRYRGPTLIRSWDPFPNPPQTRALTTRVSAASDALATWRFDDVWAHGGTAHAATGVGVLPRPEHEHPHLILDRYGVSEVALPFDLPERSTHGLDIELEQLAAARPHFVYEGVVEVHVFFDAERIATFTVEDSGTSPGVCDVPPLRCQPGPHEVRIRLSTGTTTYWLMSVSIRHDRG